MINPIAKFQIGKNGINKGVIDALLLLFKNHKQVRISMLKASGRDRNSIENMAIKITEELAKSSKNQFRYLIIGFTIIVTRQLQFQNRKK